MTAVKDPDSRNSSSVTSAGVAPNDGRNKVGPRPTNESDCLQSPSVASAGVKPR